MFQPVGPNKPSSIPTYRAALFGPQPIGSNQNWALEIIYIYIYIKVKKLFFRKFVEPIWFVTDMKAGTSRTSHVPPKASARGNRAGQRSRVSTKAPKPSVSH